MHITGLLLLALMLKTQAIMVPASICLAPVGTSDIREQVRIRYGADDSSLVKAWTILEAAGYPVLEPELLSTRFNPLIPAFVGLENNPEGPLKANRRDLLPVWDLFIKGQAHLHANPAYQTDLCALSLEVLNRDLFDLRARCAHSLLEKEKNGFSKWKVRFLKTLESMETVANSHPLFYNLNLARRFQRHRLSMAAYRRQWIHLFTYAGSMLAAHHKYEEHSAESILEGPEEVRRKVPDAAGSPAVCLSVYRSELDAGPVED